MTVKTQECSNSSCSKPGKIYSKETKSYFCSDSCLFKYLSAVTDYAPGKVWLISKSHLLQTIASKLIPIASQYGNNLIVTTITWKNDIPHVKSMIAKEISTLTEDHHYLKELLAQLKEKVDPLGAKGYSYFAFISKDRDPILHFESMKNVQELSESAGISDLSAKRLIKQLNH